MPLASHIVCRPAQALTVDVVECCVIGGEQIVSLDREFDCVGRRTPVVGQPFGHNPGRTRDDLASHQSTQVDGGGHSLGDLEHPKPPSSLDNKPEGFNPSSTQPRTYDAIAQRPGVRGASR